jgi:hypothetical protein
MSSWFFMDGEKFSARTARDFPFLGAWRLPLAGALPAGIGVTGQLIMMGDGMDSLDYWCKLVTEPESYKPGLLLVGNSLRLIMLLFEMFVMCQSRLGFCL